MRKLLVKFGTKSLLDADDKLNKGAFSEIARQITFLMREGWQVAIVTSGAVQAGREEAFEMGLSCEAWHKKDFAAPGSCRLMQMWREAFKSHCCSVGQILVTHSNLHNKGERRSIKDAVQNQMKVGAVPIINENDVVSDREIRSMEKRISENDQLTCLLASIIEPDVVISVTSIGGVFDKFPINEKSKVFKELNVAHLPVGIVESNEKTEMGSGGMSRKILELAKCCKKFRRVGIISWKNEGILRFVNGGEVGTVLGNKNRIE